MILLEATRDRHISHENFPRNDNEQYQHSEKVHQKGSGGTEQVGA